VSTNPMTLNGLGDEDKQFFDTVLLERALPNLVHAQWAQQRPIPGGVGRHIEFRRFNSLTSTEGSPLTPGTVPTGESISITTVVASVAQYGAYILGSDDLEEASIDPVLTENAEVLGEQAGQTLDRVVRNIIRAGTSVQYVNGKGSRGDIASGDVLSAGEILTAVTALKSNNARPVRDGRYVAIVHPNTVQRLFEDTTISNIFQNAYRRDDGGNPLSVGEVGDIYGVRFIESTDATNFSGEGKSSGDVYASLFIGANAYGTIEIESLRLETFFQPRGSGGASGDPLYQLWSQGWKAHFAAVILNQNFLRRVEHWSA
jgi:N4-gp56 family major capsid protein